MQRFLVLMVVTLLGIEQSLSLPESTYLLYKAGKNQNQVDRIHEESNDGTGVIRGFYTFTDPQHNMRRVDYTVDKNGFHPASVLRDFDVEAVKFAKERHNRLYERYANNNNNDQWHQQRHDDGQWHQQRHDDAHWHQQRRDNGQWQQQRHYDSGVAFMENARDNHIRLYNQIAQQHLAIGAQRAGLRY